MYLFKLYDIHKYSMYTLNLYYLTQYFTDRHKIYNNCSLVTQEWLD